MDHDRKSFRTRVFERDGCRCLVCGDAADAPHHIVPRDENGTDETSNGIALCYNCHLLAEAAEALTRLRKRGFAVARARLEQWSRRALLARVRLRSRAA